MISRMRMRYERDEARRRLAKAAELIHRIRILARANLQAVKLSLAEARQLLRDKK